MAYPPYNTGMPPAADPYAGYAYPYAAHVNPQAQRDELRTLYLTGFPTDIKERELHNLVRFLPGFSSSQLNWKSGQPQGFVLFDNYMAARAALDQLAQVQFDEVSLLRVELAHKNMYVKEDPMAKRPRTSGSFSGTTTYSADGAPAQPVAPAGFVPVTNTKDNPPCSTLFVGNLGDNVSEAEMRGLFSSQPGFKQLKIVRGGKSTTAFVEFLDVPSAMGVHERLQGAVLSTSDRGGMRIQYSKNPFGRKHDGSM